MKVSVIMPVYNSERYLEAAVNSVLMQNVDLEIIAVDDCSTDSSRAILSSLALKNNQLKVYFNEKNLGVAEVRNKAISFASGEYLAFCDSDDIVPEGAYKALASAADGFDIVIGAHRDLYDDGRLDLVCAVNSADRKSLFKSLFTVSCLWTKLIRRSFVTENALSFSSDMKIGEDVVFLAEATVKKPTYTVIDSLVYYHCQHDSSVFRSLTHLYTLEAFEKHIECRNRVLNICGNTDGAEDFIYINFSSFIADFIFKMPDYKELEKAFLLFKEHLLRYDGFKSNPKLFKALFGVEYADFLNISATAYIESVRSLPARERVLAEYEAGRVGFSWIIKYIKAWFGFKLNKRKNKND